MPRTTPTQVSGIIETETGDDLSPFIEAAASIVERIALLEVPPPEPEMELVERWLSAHYYAIYRQRAASEKAGPVSESKQYWVDFGFQTTMHGTQAMTLDSTGTLAAINAGIKEGEATKKHTTGIHFLGSKGNQSKRKRAGRVYH